MTNHSLILRIRVALGSFTAGLVLSGITAFPLLHELRLLARWFGAESSGGSGLRAWIHTVLHGLEVTYQAYPWIAYGTDWLAFGHLVIALFFIAPFIDPIRNIAVMYVGIAACILVVPLALTFGAVRGIPLYWRLLDCSFGLVGLIPLLLAVRWTGRLARLA